ncbi:uncharacterized protein B0I36DRAFT_365488 [Microdochium trichocladiopsis]|uniref:Uncharacterized protein n=1 Tax=Microdochium trichocladiopsis TaxID=1682393 RepID=A0A9P9BM19_9PEZI|nr:uncharacterized protein B0I36DRAFT_365488 [Microdochium trichocladiopsis]KAH7025825.1 hypothetical protein B0I36DRAFT_365488 [Microdochium trichocladiopsis]
MKSRLLQDEDESSTEPAPKRARLHYGAGPLFAHQQDARFPNFGAARHKFDLRARQAEEDIESPLAGKVRENYANLRAAVHLAATTQLEEARESLVVESEQTMKSYQKDVLHLEKTALRLCEPLSNAEVEYETIDKSGRPRTEIVKIGPAVGQFATKIAETSAELRLLWAT